jgi:hypothetical protein
MPLLIAGCSTRHSDAGADYDRLTAAGVVGYTPAQQKQAYEERQKFCDQAPMICRMVDDYGVMRDQVRAALGIPVDVNR